MKVQVCGGKACKERFSDYILTRLKNDKEKFDLKTLMFEESKCMGNCKQGPTVKIDNHQENYMTPVKTADIVKKKLRK